MKRSYEKLTKNEVKPKKFAGQKDDVRLCPSLYSDILLNSIQQSKSVNGCAKFAMIGKESLLGLVQTFRMVEKIRFRNNVEFNFGENYMVYEGSQALLVKLLQFSVPYVKCLEFSDSVDEWYDVVFDILSKESKQKRLLIHGLPVVKDSARTALTNMVDKGVLIEFKDIKIIVLFQLPPCNFECLIIEYDCDSEWRFLKYIKCSFRKLNLPLYEFSHIDDGFPSSCKVPDNFHIDYVQEIYSTEIEHDECTIQLFKAFKHVFPNVNTLFINLDPVTLCYLFEAFENFIVQIKKAICEAPQEYIHILWQIYGVQDEEKLIKFFNGQKIDEDTFEWKMESNEKKTIKLELREHSCYS